MIPVLLREVGAVVSGMSMTQTLALWFEQGKAMTQVLNKRIAPITVGVLIAALGCGGDDGRESFKDASVPEDDASTGLLEAGAPDAQAPEPDAEAAPDAQPTPDAEVQADSGVDAQVPAEAGTSEAGVTDAGDSSTDSGLAEAGARDGGDVDAAMSDPTAELQARVAAACNTQCTNQENACDASGGGSDAGVSAVVALCASDCEDLLPTCPTRTEFIECTAAIPFTCENGVPTQDPVASGGCFFQYLAACMM